MKIFKFGGSSVKDAAAMMKVSKIILSHDKCRVVVLSATKNRTNDLEKIGKTSSMSEENLSTDLIQSLVERHRSISHELELDIELSLLEVETELSLISKSMLGDGEVDPKKMDSLYSIGERLSSLILSKYLQRVSTKKVAYKDVREVLKTNDQWNLASPLIGETASEVSLWGDVGESDLIITQGFIGSTASGETSSFNEIILAGISMDKKFLSS